MTEVERNKIKKFYREDFFFCKSNLGVKKNLVNWKYNGISTIQSMSLNFFKFYSLNQEINFLGKNNLYEQMLLYIYETTPFNHLIYNYKIFQSHIWINCNELFIFFNEINNYIKASFFHHQKLFEIEFSFEF